jgi:hypothetical protein
VKVVTPYGEIPWANVSRISDEEMRALMLEVEDRLRQGLEKIEAFREQGLLDALVVVLTDGGFGPRGVSWDIPEEQYQRDLADAARYREERERFEAAHRIRTQAQLDEIQQRDAEVVYNDFSGNGANGRENNVLHAAGCQLVGKFDPDLRQYRFVDPAEALDWLKWHRGAEGIAWFRCGNCEALAPGGASEAR